MRWSGERWIAKKKGSERGVAAAVLQDREREQEALGYCGLLEIGDAAPGDQDIDGAVQHGPNGLESCTASEPTRTKQPKGPSGVFHPYSHLSLSLFLGMPGVSWPSAEALGKNIVSSSDFSSIGSGALFSL